MNLYPINITIPNWPDVQIEEEIEMDSYGYIWSISGINRKATEQPNGNVIIYDVLVRYLSLVTSVVHVQEVIRVLR